MTTIEQRRRNKLSQQKRRLSELVKEQDRNTSRLRRSDPEYYRKEKEKSVNSRLTPEGWAKQIIYRIRFRAKKKSLDFNIEEKDIKVPEYCPVLGMKLVPGLGEKARNSPNSPSIDRFDNSKGYIKGNIRVISQRANALKSDATIDEVEAILKYMRGEVL